MMFNFFRSRWFMTISELTIIATLAAGAQAQPYFVDANSTATTPDGLTWATAFPHLTDGIALAALNIPAEVWVAAGTYRPDESPLNPSGTGNPAATFTLHTDVQIYGGFAAWESDLSERDIKGNVTILSGNLGSSVYSYHVVSGELIDETARLDGFRITGGRALGEGDAAKGGGIWLKSTSASIIRCTIVGNQASAAGGGAWVFGTLEFSPPNPAPPREPNFTSCSLLGNAADEGGGIYNFGANMTIVNTVFSGNTATDGAGYFAAVGDEPLRSYAEFINCTYTGNDASNEAGAIKPGGVTTIKNCILYGDIPDEIAGTGAATVYYSDIEGGWGGTGSNNINSDPLFADADGADDIFGTLDDNPRLRCGSPPLEVANSGYLPPDEFDLDLNTGTTTLPFDRDDASRVVGDLDMGAYELGIGPCQADVNGDGVVGSADLLAVIAAWGSCPSCPEDIAPGSCGSGDGTVGVADLLAVIANYGLECDDGESEFGGGSAPGGGGAGGGEGGEGSSDAEQAVLICMAAAEENNLQGQAFIEFILECLCGSGVIDCGE